jgi:hypothetical protein
MLIVMLIVISSQTVSVTLLGPKPEKQAETGQKEVGENTVNGSVPKVLPIG